VAAFWAAGFDPKPYCVKWNALPKRNDLRDVQQVDEALAVRLSVTKQ
jgi:hypothetical protein